MPVDEERVRAEQQARAEKALARSKQDIERYPGVLRVAVAPRSDGTGVPAIAIYVCRKWRYGTSFRKFETHDVPVDIVEAFDPDRCLIRAGDHAYEIYDVVFDTQGPLCNKSMCLAREPGMGFAVVPEPVYFARGSAELDEEAVDWLRLLGRVIAPADNGWEVVGYVDRSEARDRRGASALARARAEAVVEVFVSVDVNPDNLEVVDGGVAPDSEDAAQQRRAQLRYAEER